MSAREAGSARPSARELAAATPATRNRYVDLLRAASIGVVVLGHWMMAVISWEEGKFVGQNLLELSSGFQLLTWVFQMMPVFFIVGGFANAASWDAARRSGAGYADWLRARFARLLRPTVAFVAVWTVGGTVVALVGVDADLVRLGGVIVSLPLWFLAVYALAVATAPVMVTAHHRFGASAVAGLVAAAAVVDVASWGFGVPVVGWLNFAFVWLALHQLGFLWRDGILTRARSTRWLLAAGGLAALAGLVILGPYPVSMVGLDEGQRTNNQPPSLALVALGMWQAGLILVFQDTTNRWLERPRAWTAVVAANGTAMTVYLWHMTAMVLTALAVYPTGIWPQVAPLGAAWWALRPVWIAAAGTILVALVAVFRGVERSVTSPPRAPEGWPGVLGGVVGAGAMCVGLALVALHGFFVPGTPARLQLLALAILVVAVALLRPVSRSQRG